MLCIQGRNLIISLALRRTKVSTEFQKHLQIFCNSPTLCCTEQNPAASVVNRSFAINFSGSQNCTLFLLSKSTNPKFSPLWFVFNSTEGCSALAVRRWVFQLTTGYAKYYSNCDLSQSWRYAYFWKCHTLDNSSV